MTDGKATPDVRQSWWQYAIAWLRNPAHMQRLRKFRRDLTNRQNAGWPVYKNEHQEETTSIPPIRLRSPKQTNLDDRGRPIVLRGRDAEFSFIANRISDMPKAILVLEGPPGAGKSSLLRAAEHYARHQGFLSVNIEHTAIRSPKELVKALHTAMENYSNESLRNTEDTDKGIFRLLHNFGAIRWSDDATKITKQAVSIAQDCGFRGLLITIDEAQHWSDEYPTKEKVPPFAKELLLHFNTQHSIAELEHPIQLLVAGTYGTVEGTCRIMSRRLAKNHSLNIGPIHENAVRQIIQDHLNFVSVDGLVPVSPSQPVVDEVLAIAQGHTAHATTLAQTLIPIAIDAAKSQDPKYYTKNHSTIITKLHQERDEYYIQRSQALEKAGQDNVTLATLFAYLEQRTGGAFKRSQIKTIAKNILPKRRDAQTENERIDSYIFDLCRRNILTYVQRTDATQNKHYQYYISPTPSFSNYLIRSTEQTDPEDHQNFQKQSQQLLPEVGSPTRKWTPPLEAAITPYETINPFPIQTQVDERKLFPPLECDETGTSLTTNDINRLCREQGITPARNRASSQNHTAPSSID